VPLPVVLVHGAWHGAWAWERVVPRLGALGVGATAVELPYTSWDDDRAHLRGVLAQSAAEHGPALLVGHSLGGGLVCEVGADDTVAALGFVTAMAVEPGQSLRERLSVDSVPEEQRDGSNPEIAAALRPGTDGTVSVDAEAGAAIFFSDCDPADAADAAGRLRPISASSLGTLPTAAGWLTKPAAYLFCTADQALSSEVQEGYAAGLRGRRDRLDASHSPFWSRPSALAGILADWADWADHPTETA
jgi:pimeloyl-ACP methyl ester carboxylesterase